MAVVGECGAGALLELLLEDVGRGVAGGEGDGAGAEFGFGVEEDDAVDEVGGEERAVEGCAGFEENAANVARVESGEDGGEIDVGVVAGDAEDFCALLLELDFFLV